jgi:hypothetical protein
MALVKRFETSTRLRNRSHVALEQQLLTLSLKGFLKSVTSRPVDWIAHKSVGESAHSRERWVVQREIRAREGAAGGGGKAAIATAPSHQDLCDTHRNRQKSAR